MASRKAAPKSRTPAATRKASSKTAPKTSRKPLAAKAEKPAGPPPGVTAGDVRKAQALASHLPGSGSPKVIESVALMQAASLALRQRGVTVGFVPTMGALHQGHLSLVEEARRHCDVVVLSIFVNPTQFGPSEDFASYTRDLKGDVLKCQGAGVDLVFAPRAQDMYPDGFQTTVKVGPVAEGACGRFRPGHFAGVATVVTKLLNIVQPHVACFGEKDWQQLQVVRRVVKDLSMPVEIVGVPTMREPSGLAMSSRNKNLTARDQEPAMALWRAIQAAQEAYAGGERDGGVLCRVAMDVVKGARGVKLQYAEVVDGASMQQVHHVDAQSRLLLAAHLGRVRLIDNAALATG